jgi:hypothetical protein
MTKYLRMLLVADVSKHSFDASFDNMKYLKGIHNKEGEISATNTKTANDKLL